MAIETFSRSTMGNAAFQKLGHDVGFADPIVAQAVRLEKRTDEDARPYEQGWAAVRIDGSVAGRRDLGGLGGRPLPEE